MVGDMGLPLFRSDPLSGRIVFLGRQTLSFEWSGSGACLGSLSGHGGDRVQDLITGVAQGGGGLGLSCGRFCDKSVILIPVNLAHDNHCVQATPDYGFWLLVRLMPGAPDAER